MALGITRVAFCGKQRGLITYLGFDVNITLNNLLLAILSLNLTYSIMPKSKTLVFLEYIRLINSYLRQ